MYMTNLMKSSPDLDTIIPRISALSGYHQSVIREVLEYFLIDWGIKIAEHPDDFVELDIPYLGKVAVKYAGDRVLPTEELATEVETYVELNDSFKKFIGELHDEEYTVLVPMIEKKMELATSVASAE